MNKLNPEQLSAVEHNSGPLLIIAGAGTGKTKVITERISYLIKSGLAKPSEILALTFTEKAAHEMQERVDIVLPLGHEQPMVATFHSFCEQVLSESGIHIGLDPKSKLLTQARAIKLVRDNLFKFDLDYFRPLGNPTKFIQGMLTHFSRLQDENISPSDYVAWAKSQETKNKKQTEEEKLEILKWRELSSAYKSYSELKIKNSLLDFGDLITKTLGLFEKRPNVLKEYQERFKFILIDEFQDTNFAQNLLAIKLAGNKGNITVVGDDDQSIFRFRGASISNILQFRKTYPNAAAVVLTKNYRTYQEILDKAYSLITHNNPDRLEVVENIDKKLIAARGSGGEIKFIHEKNGDTEAECVVNKIEKLVKNGYKYRDIAILVRANNHADIFINNLKRKGIPHQFLGPAKLFQQEEIIDLISYLKFLDNVNDDVALSRVLSISALNISGRLINEFLSKSRIENKSLFETLEQESLRVEELKKILEIVTNHLERRNDLAGTLLYEFLQKTGIYADLITDSTEEGVSRVNNISTFFERIQQQENETGSGTVSDIVEWINLSMELGESPLVTNSDWTEENKVNLLTIHSSKGLEFPVVFLVNLVAQRFPSMNRSEQIPIPDKLIKEILPQGDFHIEEERRLFYVGMTRARDILYLTAADFYNDAKRAKKLSSFIFEADVTEAETLNFKAKPSITYQVSSIKHNTKYKILNTKVDRLSYSAISTFRICPLHYKLAYIMKIPTPPSSAMSLGISVHATMEEIFKTSNHNYRDVLENNWINKGYLDKLHSEKSFEKAEKYISDYFEKEYKGEKPLALEKSFNIKIDPNLKITGKIDRIDKLSNDYIEIIDYKTGSSVPSQREVDRDLQLSIYALAARELYKGKSIKLSLYYFEEGVKLSTTRTEEQLKEAIKEILEVRHEIENSDFRCSGHMFCDNCEYSLYCKQVKV